MTAPATGTDRFEFATATRIVVGAGSSAELPVIVSELGSRVLVCTGAHPDRHAALIAAIGLPTCTFPVAGEPTVELARSAAAVASSFAADVVVAIGGGSPVDLGKAVAMLRGNGGDPLDYLEVVGRGQAITRPSIPFIAVPTTAGSGTEVTANAVLTSVEHGRKASLRARSMLPAVALVDPLLTLGCTPAVTAASGLDAVTQCLEPLVSPFATPITDLFASEGLDRAGRSLSIAYFQPTDVEARTDMAVCSLFGGLSLANAKLGAVHGLAGVIGGLTDLAHGAICAMLLAPVTEANVRALQERVPGSPALGRFTRAAQLLTGSADATIADALEWIRRTVAALHIPAFADLGVAPDRLDAITTMAAASSSMRGNPVVLTAEELRSCLTSR